MVQTRVVYSFITFVHFSTRFISHVKFSKWPSIARTIITVAISVIVLASITYYGNLQMIVPATSISNNETKETTENTVNDKDELNHKAAVEETKTNYDSTKENTKEPAKENESATRLENSALERQSHILMISTCLN